MFDIIDNFEKLNSIVATSLIGLLIDICASKNDMTGPEFMEYMKPLVQSVYNELGEWEK